MKAIKTQYITALDVASFFIHKGGVSPLKLQKLLYYAQVWSFVKFKRKLFKDDILAWVYGPVVYNIWDEFKYVKKGSSIPITRLKEYDFTYKDKMFLEEVWNAYGHLSSAQLVDLTHSEKPWRISRIGYLDNEPGNTIISIDAFTTSEYILDANNKIPKADFNKMYIGRFENRLY